MNAARLLMDWDLLATRLMWTLAHFLWQGTLVALAVAVLLRFFRRAAAASRYALLFAALAAMLIAPATTFVAIGRSAYNPPDTAGASEFAAVHSTSFSEAVSLNRTYATADTGSSTSVYLHWVTGLYFAGVLGFLARLLLGLDAGRRLRKQADLVNDDALLSTLRRQAAALGMHRTPLLAYCRHCTVPTVVGVLRPMILLPLCLATSLTTEELRSILAHELAHIRRHDPLIHLLERLAEAVFFFHPAIWWLTRQLRLERENCCDDAAVSLGATRVTYAASLLRVAEWSQARRPQRVAAFGLAATRDPSALRSRIARLLEVDAPSRMRLSAAWPLIAALVLSALLLGNLATGQSEPPADDAKAPPVAEQDPPAKTEPAGDAPIYENYFSGGYSTLRGFQFRGAWPPTVSGLDVDIDGPERLSVTEIVDEKALKAQRHLVVEIRIDGLRTISREKVLANIATKIGRPFDDVVFTQDVKKLHGRNWFQTVKSTIQSTSEGAILGLEVLERPTSQHVRFLGNVKIKESTLQKETGLKENRPLDAAAVEEGQRKIEALYRSKGFHNVKVHIVEGNKPGDEGAIYVISEDGSPKNWRVEFLGNTVTQDRLLKTVFESSLRIAGQSKAAFDRGKLDESVEKLSEYYRGQGYLLAQIGREYEVDEKGQLVTVRLKITEGVRYRVNKIAFVGNEHCEDSAFVSTMKLKPGDFFVKSKVDSDIAALKDIYAMNGYVFANIKHDLRLYEEPGKLDVIFHITEGKQWTVSDVRVRAGSDDPQSKRTQVPPMVSVYPGDIINARQLRASEQAVAKQDQTGTSSTPVRKPGDAKAAELVWTVLGLRLKPLSAEMLREVRRHEMSMYEGGLEVTDVDPGTSQQTGIRKGDILVGLDGFATETMSHVEQILLKELRENPVPLRVLRDAGNRRFQTLYPKLRVRRNDLL